MPPEVLLIEVLRCCAAQNLWRRVRHQNFSVALYQDWTAAKKSAELHLYAKGGHGFGMRTQNLPSDRWISLFMEWLSSEGFLKR